MFALTPAFGKPGPGGSGVWGQSGLLSEAISTIDSTEADCALTEMYQHRQELQEDIMILNLQGLPGNRVFKSFRNLGFPKPLTCLGNWRLIRTDSYMVPGTICEEP